MINSTDHSVIRPKPGHGMAIDSLQSVIPNAVQDVGDGRATLELITLREIEMLGFINAVTDKSQWTGKVFDKSYIAKWNAEVGPLKEEPTGREFTEAMYEYCIKELQQRAGNHGQSPGGAIHVFPGDVYKSDTAVSEETKLALQKAVRVLEDVPAREKDWHPDADGQVLDLVHPSLFPLVYGVSKILPVGAKSTTLEDCVERCGEGELLPSVKLKRTTRPYSSKFQWLPCEVDVSSGKAKITTYINNLHPAQHRELYLILEELISAALPLWELTLAPLAVPGYQALRRIPYKRATYTVPAEYELKTQPIFGLFGSDTLYDFAQRLFSWRHNRQAAMKFDLPEPGSFAGVPQPPSYEFSATLAPSRNLQVIVKIATIQLTPDSPKYEGGTWHVEGTRNENICASATYYFSSSNITTSYLAFRQQSKNLERHGMSFERDFVRKFMPAAFGINESGSTIQTLGKVDTHEGRLVTFPNILQNQVEPFELKDPTKPGHRKMVALFLVDPNVDIISTADVPPQRRDWWQNELALGVQKEPAVFPVATDRLSSLPPEILRLVVDGVEDFPIDMATAKLLREELIEERNEFSLYNSYEFAAESMFISGH